MRSGALASPILLILALAGCSTAAGSGQTGATSDCSITATAAQCAERIQALDAELRRLIGAAACDSGADCGTVPLGVKPCGGPARYVAYSRRDLNAPTFRAVVTDLNRLYRRRADAEARAGMVSDCSVVTDPGTACRAGRCVLGQ